MIFFITVLRALAACLITNSHYTGIYPSDIIANGGLIGDIIFFAVSGYCLYNVKENFIKWYGKRIIRCYVPVIIITCLYMLTGFYTLDSHSLAWWLVYPTNYHFVASIVVLYIPYYFIIKIGFLRNKLPHLMLAVALAGLAVYCFFYDKSYYHIDTVREPFIRFLFMESMLLGAWFRQKDQVYRNKFSVLHVISVAVTFVLYFLSKTLFAKNAISSEIQIANQVLIFLLLFAVFRLFIGIDQKLDGIPKVFKRLIDFVAAITLEIYVVQYVLIDLIRPLFGFPVNWIVLTGAIGLSAIILHYVSDFIVKRILKIIH